ncbi:hypothetical protein SO802_008137 [Lithocarpus litseifolius]|uniref:Uncharacterized protein n=1 Tax=Lithocarpus litseifolius TaxID=425828 RepID=A0AAW2DBH9_9ROSI
MDTENGSDSGLAFDSSNVDGFDLGSSSVAQPIRSNPNPMTVTFSDLHTESGLKSLDEFLSGKSYVSGDDLTKDDIKVYAAVLVKPGDSLPNVCKWYDAVSSQLAASFPGKAVGVRVGGKGAPVVAAPAKEETYILIT